MKQCQPCYLYTWSVYLLEYHFNFNISMETNKFQLSTISYSVDACYCTKLLTQTFHLAIWCYSLRLSSQYLSVFLSCIYLYNRPVIPHRMAYRRHHIHTSFTLKLIWPTWKGAFLWPTILNFRTPGTVKLCQQSLISARPGSIYWFTLHLPLHNKTIP